MKWYGTKLKLWLVFILIIIIPSFLLGVISFQAVKKEEIYLEKQLEESFRNELVHITALINDRMENLLADLNDQVQFEEGEDPIPKLIDWQDQDLVKIAFLISYDNELLWPAKQLKQFKVIKEFKVMDEKLDLVGGKDEKQISRLRENNLIDDFSYNESDEIIKAEEASYDLEAPEEKKFERVEMAQQEVGNVDPSTVEGFFEEHEEFLKSNEPAPVYQNIVAKNAPAKPSSQKKLFNKEKKRKAVIPQTKETESVNPLSSFQSFSRKDAILQEQRAVGDFDKSPQIQQQFYDRAEEKGQKVAKRQISVMQKQKMPVRQKSVFVIEDAIFTDIVKEKSYGVIPRIVNNELTFLFWKKDPLNNFIIGCELDYSELKKRILFPVFDTRTETRILAVFDEKGNIINEEGRAWLQEDQKPFASLEIGETLPQWEASIFLPGDGLLPGVQTKKFTMTGLIGILFVVLVFGGIFTFYSLHGEAIMAQKKTNFVTNVSHELRTPLTPIIMFTEMLETKKELPAAKQKQYLKIIKTEATRLASLISNILTFSSIARKRKKFNYVKLNVVEFIKEIVESQRDYLEEKGFKISLDTKDNSLLARIDTETFKQVMINLLSNAEKYSDGGKEILVDIQKQNSNIVIDVKDKGIGINKKNSEKIFSEFYRVDDSLSAKVSGTGLGLSIARQIITAHKGKLIYLPRRGGGSIFRITIPEEI